MQKPKLMKEWKAVVLAFFIALPAVMCINSVGISTLDILYVDDDNVNGPWDGTQEHPYQHIQDAVDIAGNGDAVFVYSGLYQENIRIKTSITVRGEDKDTTIVDGAYGRDTSFDIATDYVTITGFTIQNSGTGVYIGGSGSTASHNTITENCIVNTNCGIDVYYGNPYKPEFLDFGYNTISANIIRNTTYYAIRIVKGCNNMITRNSISENHGSAEGRYGYGIDVSGAFNNVSYNHVFNNERFGIIIGETYHTIVYRNTIEKNGLYGLAIALGSFDTIKQNNFLENRRHAIFVQPLQLMVQTYFRPYPFLPPLWNENYWDSPRQIPYVIPGFIGCNGLIASTIWNRLDVYPVNWMRLDWHPAQEPYPVKETT
jgi:parallel beta-helix repeat protein